MRARAVVLAVALVLAPLGARAADLVVWWEKGFYPEEDEAVREIIAAFEQKTGKQVELVLPSAGRSIRGQDRGGARGRAAARLRLRHLATDYLRPMGLRGSAGRSLGRGRPVREPVRSGRARLRHAARRDDRADVPSTGCRWAVRPTTSTSGRACWSRPGFTLADIPKEWEAFWSFWCDQVQPAVRKATGRDDIWGVGLAMSAEAADTDDRVLAVRGRPTRPTT